MLMSWMGDWVGLITAIPYEAIHGVRSTSVDTPQPLRQSCPGRRPPRDMGGHQRVVLPALSLFLLSLSHVAVANECPNEPPLLGAHYMSNWHTGKVRAHRTQSGLTFPPPPTKMIF